MPVLIALCLGLGAFLLTRALLVEGRAPTSVWRDHTFGRARRPERAAPRPSDAVLRSRSFFERVARATPRLQHPAEEIVTRAGLSTRFSGSWLIGVSAVAGVGMLLFWILAGTGDGLDRNDLLIAPAVAVVAAAAPWVLLSGRAKRRQETIDRALPDVLDLLVVSIEAGLALEGALQRVSERGVGALAEEIRRTLNEIALGRRRHDALIGLAQRTSVPPLQTLVNAMNQAERSGMQLGPVLRAQADQIRIRRRQFAEEKAMKAPLKMLFPLVLFIFPSMFLVIMGPAVISLVYGMN